jgi:protein O-GlcNAc transferase
MIGSEFAERGEIDEAIRILQYAVSLNPGLPYAYDSLGWCYRQKGLIEEAIRSYEKALQLSPEDITIRKALEELKKKQGAINQ